MFSFEIKPALDETVVSTVRTYAQDVVVSIRRGDGRGSVWDGAGNLRGRITGFSKDSRRRLLFTARNMGVRWTGFITLTYRAGSCADGLTVKRDLNVFLKWLRSQGLKYVWVLEFTKVGTPHIHILVNGWVPKAALGAEWCGIVGGGEDGLAAGTRVEELLNPGAGAAYIAKYVGKAKCVPDGWENVGRFWGASRYAVKHVYRVVSDYRAAARFLRTFRRWRGRWRSWRTTGGDLKSGRDRWDGFGFVMRNGAALSREWFEMRGRAQDPAGLAVNVRA